MQLTELNELVKSLGYGAKREIARRLRVGPPKITDALDGFVKNEQFMESLAAEAMNMKEERKAVA